MAFRSRGKMSRERPASLVASASARDAYIINNACSCENTYAFLIYLPISSSRLASCHRLGSMSEFGHLVYTKRCISEVLAALDFSAGLRYNSNLGGVTERSMVAVLKFASGCPKESFYIQIRTFVSADGRPF